MDPKDYTAAELRALMRELDAKTLRKSLRGVLRREANAAVKVARRALNSTGLKVRGDRADWEKGVRAYVYTKAVGFAVTVQPRKAGKGPGGAAREASMHRNRRGVKKPVLMWAADGTTSRRTKTKTRVFVRKKKGHDTGRMKRYPFLDRATPEMFRKVEGGLLPDLSNSIQKAAKKAGFT